MNELQREMAEKFRSLRHDIQYRARKAQKEDFEDLFRLIEQIIGRIK